MSGLLADRSAVLGSALAAALVLAIINALCSLALFGLPNIGFNTFVLVTMSVAAPVATGLKLRSTTSPVTVGSLIGINTMLSAMNLMQHNFFQALKHCDEDYVDVDRYVAEKVKRVSVLLTFIHLTLFVTNNRYRCTHLTGMKLNAFFSFFLFISFDLVAFLLVAFLDDFVVYTRAPILENIDDTPLFEERGGNSANSNSTYQPVAYQPPPVERKEYGSDSQASV